MINLKTKLLSSDDDVEYEFECFENTEPIEIGDKYLYTFMGFGVEVCETENERLEINENNRESTGFGDLITGFWEKCYKIKTTNYELESKGDTSPI